MLSSFHCHAYEKMIQWIIFECRALREDDPKEKSELSANGTVTLNENERSEVRIWYPGTCRAHTYT